MSKGYLLCIEIFCVFAAAYSLQTYDGFDASCLMKCLGKEQLLNVSVSDRQFCDDVLIEAYHLCSSFDIGTARCQRQSQCRQLCSVEEWCYFGTGMVANCRGGVWHNLTGSSLEFYADCMTAESLYSDGSSGSENHISAGARLQTIALIIVVAFLGGTISLLLLHLFKFCPGGTSRDSYRSGGRGLFSRVAMDDASDHSFNFEDSDMSSASSMISFGQGRQTKASFYKEKFQIWTGARRKKDVNNEYELSLSQSVQASNNADNDVVNRALTDAVSSSSSD